MIALILARGGSKSVPRKNIADLNGKPLIAYPIEAAIASKNIGKGNVFVSTEDEEISEIAKKYGAIVIQRPKELAGDHVPDLPVFRHFVRKEMKHPLIRELKHIVHLRATSPTITPNLIDAAIVWWNLNKAGFTSMRSAHRFPESVYKFFKMHHNGIQFLPMFESENEQHNLPKEHSLSNYLPNGLIDIVKPTVFMDSDTLHGDKILAFITEPVIEIDSLYDLELLRKAYKKNLNQCSSSPK